MWQWSAARRLGLAACASALVITLAPGTAAAQSRVDAFDYWAAVNAAYRETGPITNPKRGNVAAVARLADAMLSRGQFYLDLYEYDRRLVRDHARMRDSIGKAGGARSQVAPFYLGRGLQALGDSRAAATAYRNVGAAAPATLRTEAAAWAATIARSNGGSWQQQLVSWQAGALTRVPTCSAGERSCAFLAALLANDIPAIALLQGEFASATGLEQQESVRSSDGQLTLTFHDPAVFWLLGMADFALAAHVLDGVAQGAALRGVALLQLGRVKEAIPLLARATAAGGAQGADLAVYLGAARYRAGDRAAAEQDWTKATGSARNRLADLQTQLGVASNMALAQFRAEQGRGLQRLRGGRENAIHLGRALLRQGRAAEALNVLEQVRPPSAGTDLALVRPEVLVLLSHARYQRGLEPGMRDNLPTARAELSPLAASLPPVRLTMDLLQHVTVPQSGGAGSRGFE